VSITLAVALSCLAAGFAVGLLLRAGLARAERRARPQQQDRDDWRSW
jgi:F0F1-type ATP synthase membrane subunit c/vacuolar-type H+-ATPase subunit K